MIRGALVFSLEAHWNKNHKRVLATTRIIITRIKGAGDWRSAHSSSSPASWSVFSQKDRLLIFWASSWRWG
jgi:hypothetical protein